MRVSSFSFPAFFRDDRCTLLCKGADSTRIGLCPHVASCFCSVRSVTGKHVAVFFPLELSELVKVDEVVSFTLVVSSILCVLHRSKIDLGARRKRPHMFTLVKHSSSESSWVYLCGSIHKLRKLRIRLSQYQPTIVWYVYLSQCLV